MNWSVTYRENGRQTVAEFDADSREALFKTLSGKGIQAIRVVEAKARQNRKHHICPTGKAVAWSCVVLGVVAMACLALIHFDNHDENRTLAAPSEGNKQTAEATPIATPSTESPQIPVKLARRTTAKGTPIPDNVRPDDRGVLRYPGGLRWVDTNDLHVVKHPREKQLFKHHSENSIATILTLEPEKMAPFLVGRRPKFGQRFVDDFKASLYDEPEFPDDDTPEERNVRNLVLDVKKELKAALDRGEDIAKMMNDAQDELDRLVSYRDNLMKQLKEVKDDDKYSDDDVRDFTAAANQMLKSHGLQELATPNLTYRQFMLQRKRERAKAETPEP